MTEILANAGPILMSIAIGWLIFSLWCSIAVGMILEADMEREDLKRKSHGDQ